MHTTNQLLDALSKKFDGASDYRLAKLLNTSTSAITAYRKHRRVVGPEIAVIIAELLGWEHAYVVACVEHERAQKSAYEHRMPADRAEKVIAVWKAIAEHFRSAAVFILFTALALLGMPKAQATQAFAPFQHDSGVRVVYILCNIQE